MEMWRIHGEENFKLKIEVLLWGVELKYKQWSDKRREKLQEITGVVSVIRDVSEMKLKINGLT